MIKRRKARGTAISKILHMTYNGGTEGCEEDYKVSLTVASSRERLTIEAAAADFAAEVKAKAQGSKLHDMMDAQMRAQRKAEVSYKRRGELTPPEMIARKIVSEHIEYIRVVDGYGSPNAEEFDAVFELEGNEDGKTWGEMNQDERSELMTRHPALFACIESAILPKASEEVEGKSEMPQD
jgi:hypothetical protein